jgi:DNA-binding transcriptional MerR regulator
MRTGQLAEWLNVSSGTIKNWTSEFADFLSDDAQGGDKYRDFTEMDTRIMLLIAALRDKNTNYEDIHAQLELMQKAEWSELPQLPDRPPGIGPVELMPVSEHESSVNLEKQRLLREIAIRQDQISDLETRLEGEQAAHTATREQLTTAREELGKAQGKLETIEATAERERASWADNRKLLLRAVIVLGVVLAVAVIALVWLALQGGAV